MTKQTTAETWRGILLDPATSSITEIEVPANWRAIAPAIDADLFDVVRVRDDGHVLYVDDEGLLKSPVHTATIWHGYPSPLVGKLLLLGTNSEGDTISATMSVEEVRNSVGFVTSFGCSASGAVFAFTDDLKLVRVE